MKKNSFETILYSVLGVIILLGILVGFNLLASTVKQRVDLTKEKAYTLSAGTRAILKKLDTPVKIRYYFSSSDADSANTVQLKTYGQQVLDLLNEYKQAGNGKIILEQFDPKPDSDAEDSARLDGVEGAPMQSGEKFYMGLSVSLLDSKEAIPFFDPNRERLLEYDLSRAITRVMNSDKPVVGVMSPLPVFGKPGNPMMAQMGQPSQGQDPWVFIGELKEDFTLREVEMTAAKIDEDIKVLVVIHPKEITDQTQYAIDQFIMRGGKLIAYLDATSLVDSHSQSMMGSMPGGGSSFDKLLKAWGLQFDISKVAADLKYKVKMSGRDGQPNDAPAFLDLSGDAINKDDVATSEIHDIWYPFGGVFTGTPVAGLKETVLLKTTKESQLVDGMMATFSGENIMKDFKPSGIEYALAIRLTGKFKTGFPDGKPKEANADAAKPADKPADKSTDDTLKETKGEGVVVLFGDADMLYDQFALRQQQTILGPMGYVLANGNLTLAQNLVDQLAGSSDLISVRSRSGMDRPFTVIKDMEAKSEESFQSKIKEFEDSLQETRQKVNELQSKKEQGGIQRFILSPEQQVELDKLKKKEVEVNMQVKAERKKLKHNVDSLKNSIEWGNIIAMPALVALSGIGLAFVKRKRTAAK